MHERVLAVPLLRTGGHPSAERRSLQRRAHRGELVAIRPGVLVEPDQLAPLLPEERHLLLIRATVPWIEPPVRISHRSAALVHGLPIVGTPPDKVEVTDPRRLRSETSTLRRVRADPERADPGHADRPGRWDGLAPTEDVDFLGTAVTPLVRTLVDVAATVSLLDALPMVDAALHDRRVLPAMLADEVDLRTGKGAAKAMLAVRMGSSLTGSPAESICRVRLRQLGTPEPIQQHLFTRAGARDAVVDFWFPEHGVVVEVDGRAKYQDPVMLGGMTTADAHWHEKQREDFVRSFPGVRTVVRLTWADLMDPDRMRAKLRRAGVPCR